MAICDHIPSPFCSRQAPDVESQGIGLDPTFNNAVGTRPSTQVTGEDGEVLLVYSSRERVLPIYKINQKINTQVSRLDKISRQTRFFLGFMILMVLAALGITISLSVKFERLSEQLHNEVSAINGHNATEAAGVQARAIMVDVTSHDAITVANWGEQYEMRTAQHQAFMDDHLPAFLEEITNITVTFAEAAGITAYDLTDIQSALKNATDFFEELNILQHHLRELAAVLENVSTHPDGLPELAQSLVDHYLAINSELNNYQAFLTDLNTIVNEFKESHPAFRNLTVVKPTEKAAGFETLDLGSLKLDNTTATPICGSLPAMNDIKESLVYG